MEIKQRKRLSNQFRSTLKESGKFKLNVSFLGFKFDEFRVRFDLDEYNKFSIGDSFIGSLYLIAAFVEVRGHLKGNSRIETIDMACVIAQRDEEVNREVIYSFHKTEDGSILLYSLE